MVVAAWAACYMQEDLGCLSASILESSRHVCEEAVRAKLLAGSQ